MVNGLVPVDYDFHSVEISKSSTVDVSLSGLRGCKAALRLKVRIEPLENGDIEAVKPDAEGIGELPTHRLRRRLSGRLDAQGRGVCRGALRRRQAHSRR